LSGIPVKPHVTPDVKCLTVVQFCCIKIQISNKKSPDIGVIIRQAISREATAIPQITVFLVKEKRNGLCLFGISDTLLHSSRPNDDEGRHPLKIHMTSADMHVSANGPHRNRGGSRFLTLASHLKLNN
jgi:hypothetical protein